MGKRQAIRIIEQFVRALKKEGVIVDRAILYGSHAKGKARPESDIDVAIVSKNFGKNRLKEGMFLYRVAGRIDSRLEPFPISIQSFENDTWIPLIYEIRANGVKVEIK